MLKRVLEPELMDTPAEALDYDTMDHAGVNRQFVDDLLALWRPANDEAKPEVLDLGTGTAQIPIELCGRHDALCVLAVDLAPSMLDVARGNVEIACLTDRIRFDCLDAKRLPYEDGRFDCVMSNSIVHHIPKPESLLAEAVRVLAPGGCLFFRDLARPSNEETVQQLVEMYAGEANPHQRQMFEDSLRAALTQEEVQAMLEALGVPGDSVTMTSDRHWTWTLVEQRV